MKCELEKFGLLGGFYRLLLNLIDLVNRMVKVEKRELFSQIVFQAMPLLVPLGGDTFD